MRPRIQEELALLREHFPLIDHQEADGQDWFKLVYPFPAGWRIGDKPIEEAPVCFPVQAGYPAAHPYGFLAPAGINFRGSPPGNTGSSTAPPFEGQWQHFSWHPDGWQPAAKVREGDNLWIWIRSFRTRLLEGS